VYIRKTFHWSLEGADSVLCTIVHCSGKRVATEPYTFNGMAVAVRLRQNGERWYERIEHLVGSLVEGRAMLVTQHPGLVHVLPASLALPLARQAVDDIVAVVSRRMNEFTSVRAVRGGPVWGALKAKFVDACVEVERVKVILDLDITELLDDDRAVSSLTSVSSEIGLTIAQRAVFENWRISLAETTDLFSALALSEFNAGRHLV